MNPRLAPMILRSRPCDFRKTYSQNRRCCAANG